MYKASRKIVQGLRMIAHSVLRKLNWSRVMLSMQVDSSASLNCSNLAWFFSLVDPPPALHQLGFVVFAEAVFCFFNDSSEGAGATKFFLVVSLISVSLIYRDIVTSVTYDYRIGFQTDHLRFHADARCALGFGGLFLLLLA